MVAIVTLTATPDIPGGKVDFAIAAGGGTPPYTVDVVGIPDGDDTPSPAQVRLGHQSDDAGAPIVVQWVYGTAGPQTVSAVGIPAEGAYRFVATVSDDEDVFWDGVIVSDAVVLAEYEASGSVTAPMAVAAGAGTFETLPEYIGAGAVTAPMPAVAGAGTYEAASGGASGNFTFSILQTIGDAHVTANAIETISGGLTAGSHLIAICGMRSDRSSSHFRVTDNNGNDSIGGSPAWKKRIGVDNELGNTNARMSFAVFDYAVTGSEVDQTPIVTFSDDATEADSGGTRMMVVLEIAPSASYGWVWKDAAGAGQGAGEWDAGAGTGSISPTGDDILAISIAVGRHGTSNNPTDLGTDFDTQVGGIRYFDIGNNNEMTVLLSAATPSGAAGTYSDTLTSDSSGTEGALAILAWGDT